MLSKNRTYKDSGNKSFKIWPSCRLLHGSSTLLIPVDTSFPGSRGSLSLCCVSAVQWSEAALSIQKPLFPGPASSHLGHYRAPGRARCATQQAPTGGFTHEPSDLTLKIYRAESYAGLQEFKAAIEYLNAVLFQLPNWPEVKLLFYICIH